MGRPRGFDWAEAKRLRSQGLTLKAIAAKLGVSDTCVGFAVNDRARERQYAAQRERRYWLTGTCVDCGSTITRDRTRCVPCHATHQTFTVRVDTLLCTTCDQWLPDDSFAAGRTQGRRRRHAVCRGCQAEVKREWRRNNPEKARAADIRDAARKLEKRRARREAA